MAFSIGGVVKLKSGGPNMTIDRCIGDSDAPGAFAEDLQHREKGLNDGDLVCEWIDKSGKVQRRAFRQESVEQV